MSVGWRESAEASKPYEPYADEVYRELFPSLAYVERERVRHTAMDRKLHIDGFLTLDNGMRLYFQEKFLTTNFRSMTIEFMSDDQGTKGEWFHTATQLYTTAYVKPEGGFREVLVVSYPTLAEAIANRRIRPLYDQPKQNAAFGTSSFWAYSIDDIRTQTNAVLYWRR